METLFERLLREKIILLQDVRRQTIEGGLSSFEEYRESVEYLEALRRVLDLCDEVNSDMRKE